MTDERLEAHIREWITDAYEIDPLEVGRIIDKTVSELGYLCHKTSMEVAREVTKG